MGIYGLFWLPHANFKSPWTSKVQEKAGIQQLEFGATTGHEDGRPLVGCFSDPVSRISWMHWMVLACSS